MGKFTLTIRFAEHAHAPRAHRQVIEHLLQQVQQQVGAGEAERGDITTAGGGAEPGRVVGEWQLTEDF